jgi:alkylation response protein AidB-like acyl-CoA dehydrogenase
MNYLAPERSTLERYLPGLDDKLTGVDLETLEQPGNPGLSWFRAAHGPRLVIPEENSGLESPLLDAIRVQRAIGSRSPSLAVATTMHHFSVASIVELSRQGAGLEWAMLEAIATQDWLVSSGFAEGRTGQHILSPVMKAVPVDGGLTVSGSKKPCSLTWSMDLLSASVTVNDPAGGPDRMAVVLLRSTTEGIERRPFWASRILAGAESDEVALSDVYVPEALVFYPQGADGMGSVQSRGFIWFELLIAASYIGAASGLVERVLLGERGHVVERVRLASDLDAAAAALERASQLSGDDSTDLARALSARYHAEDVVTRVANDAAGLLGGMAFIGSSDVSYLMSACRALAFHPPSRAAAAEALARHLAGSPLVI